MNRLLFATVLAIAAARAAAADPSYAAISLIGDKLDIVTYQPAVGSELDSTTHLPLALQQDDLDTAALRAIARAAHDTLPGTSVTLLAASTPESFADQDRLFDGNHATLPPEVAAALQREGAAMVVLVSKHRGEARLQARNDKIGSGRIAGLGFYVDSNKRMLNHDNGKRSIGYIAPFVYVDVSLVDVATGTVVRRKTIESSEVIGTANNPGATTAWEALTSAQKLAMLTRMLTRQLQTAVPALLTGQASPADPTAGPGTPQ
jgi:hypothetical protein